MIRLFSSVGRRILTDYVPMAVTAVLIIVFSVLLDQPFLKMLPTLNTLVVMVLMARANRYGFLLGGCNAALYGVIYLMEGLYFSSASSLLFSFPMQIWSFFHWKKHSAGQTVEFRFLRPLPLLLTLGGTLVGWVVSFLALRPLFTGAIYPELDAYLFVSGITVTVLMALRFVEAQYLNLIAGILSLVMWMLIVADQPENMNYLIITVYNLARTAEASVRWTVQYRKQKKEGALG